MLVAQGLARPGRRGGMSRRLALQALGAAWAAGRARGQAHGRPTRRFRGINAVGHPQSGAVRGLIVKAADAAGRQRSGTKFEVGDTVEVCFDVKRRGFVSMWSIGADGGLTRAVPNAHTPSGADAVPVREGRRYCVDGGGNLAADDGRQVAEGTGAYSLQVGEPVGSSSLLLYWTTEKEQQPEAELALDIDGLDAAIRKRRLGTQGSTRGPLPAVEAVEAKFEIVSGGAL